MDCFPMLPIRKLLYLFRSCLSVCLAVVACGTITRADETNTFTPPAIKVPEGFVLELAAAPPLVKHPMLACLDDRGRLFIAETDGRNLKKEELLQEKARFIRMLEDTDDDGKFDKSTIFADKMVMPEGALWHNNALYVVSAPYLWRLEDTDDDGVADKREKLVGEFELNGNPNQSGPYLGPCGRIYFTGGVFGYDLVGADGKRLGKGSAAGVFSCRADGTDLEVFGQGPVNPVDVEFTPDGELLTTAAIFDGVDGRHDALIHWIDGALTHTVYGKPLLPDTGYRLPALSRWGQVAPAGLKRYRGTAFGAAFRDNYFACQFNTHQVVRTQIAPHGSTFQSVDENFLTSEAIDFHPTDVLEDADGSLLVIDTGGWVYYGCPTSKIAKPHVLGAIYRIRKAGAAPVDDPRGRQLDWTAASDEMIARLDDPRPAVRDRTIDMLAGRGAAAVSALDKSIRSSDIVRVRRNAIWTLSRIGTPPALEPLRAALTDSDATVRQAAIRSVGILKDPGASDALLTIL
ncbi:MAG: PVC-type heme-binding CxxCH protein, partial [Pirellulales bacterium]